MNASERIERWQAARHQTTDDVIARHAAQPRTELAARTPLTASQHILHLLLTVITAGLWAPVWIIRSMQGNRRAVA
jgi:hypothetical protein